MIKINWLSTSNIIAGQVFGTCRFIIDYILGVDSSMAEEISTVVKLEFRQFYIAKKAEKNN